MELNKVFNNGVDLFDIQCLAEWMCNKGTLTSTTRAGIASFYEEENVLKCMAFERTCDRGQGGNDEDESELKGLSEKILINDLIDTGSVFATSSTTTRFIEGRRGRGSSTTANREQAEAGRGRGAMAVLRRPRVQEAMPAAEPGLQSVRKHGILVGCLQKQMPKTTKKPKSKKKKGKKKMKIQVGKVTRWLG